MAALSNNTAKLKGVKLGVIFTGESYGDILAELESAGEDADSRLVGYGVAYRELTLPFHLVPCTDTGALQLRLMALSDYREKLTRYALKDLYKPAPKRHPEWDALLNGSPFVIAADMDLKRIDTAINSAQIEVLLPISLGALDGQAREVLNVRYRQKGLAKVFVLRAISDVPDLKLSLYTPPNTQFITPKGDVVNAPFIQAHRKN